MANRLKLQPDTVIELEESDEALVIRRSGASPSPLIEQEGLLVHTGTLPADFDWSGFVEAVRDERIRDLAGK